MEPTTILAGASALSGLLGAARGGGTRVDQTNQTTTTVSQSVGTANNIAFNPVVAAITGQGSGVAPATSGNASGQLSMSPSTSSPPYLASDPGNALPRSSPTGFAYGPGFGYTAPRTVAPSGGDDFLWILIIGGAVIYFAMSQGE